MRGVLGAEDEASVKARVLESLRKQVVLTVAHQAVKFTHDPSKRLLGQVMATPFEGVEAKEASQESASSRLLKPTGVILVKLRPTPARRTNLMAGPL